MSQATVSILDSRMVLESQIGDARLMAEIAAELASDLTADETREHFQIQYEAGNRLCFAVNDVLARIDRLFDAAFPTKGE
jgi:hypothetical protein